MAFYIGVMVILFYLFFTMTQQASFAIGYCTVMLAYRTAFGWLDSYNQIAPYGFL